MNFRKLVVALAIVLPTAVLSGQPTFAAGVAMPQGGEFKAAKIPVLLNETLLTIKGTPVGHGGCVYSPPKLTLAPSQKALEADEVSVNTAACTSVWLIGTPTNLNQQTAANYSTTTQIATPTTTATSQRVVMPSIAAALTASSGYTYAWIEDVVGLATTSDQTNIAWTWDGCVHTANGSANWWWLSETGWQAPTNKGVWINTYCVWSKVWSQADFSNPSFCWPFGTVYAHYRGVSVRGWGNGNMDGWVDSMWTNNSCAPLFTHYRVVRTV